VIFPAADLIAIPFRLRAVGSYLTYGPPAMSGAPMDGTGIPAMGPRTSRRVAPGAITFSDVPDPDALLAAINRAKSAGQPGTSR
jgi:hypothetical protein